MVRLRVPIATYRLQLNKHFRFQDVRVIVPYLCRLGISDLYISPILKARQGSLHGYDVTDPSHLNPELGTEEEFDELVRELKAHAMGLLLDIVPNHLAIDSDNPWWMDILENGLTSSYAAFFDIDWHPPRDDLENRVLLPVLSTTNREAFKNQEIHLTLEETGFFIHYHNLSFPLDIKSYNLVISHRLNTLEDTLGADHPTFQRLKQLIDAMERLPAPTNLNIGTLSESYNERQLLKEKFSYLVRDSLEVRMFILENVAQFNGRRGDPQSFDHLDMLLAQQVYQLAFWKTALQDINYRRFFDISDLIGIRVEAPNVFEATHAQVLQLVRQKDTGLRIDHIDGLYNPLEYLCRLQHHLDPQANQTGASKNFYVVVEKILTGDETLPEEWPVYGTTGYDFLNMLNGLFVDAKGAKAMEATHVRLTTSGDTFNDVVYKKKRQVIEELFAGELHALGRSLARLAQSDQHNGELSQKELAKAIAVVTACLAVYRTYTRNPYVHHQDRQQLEHALIEARQREPTLANSALPFLERVLLLDFTNNLPPEQKEAWLHFVMRWQQFTGPVMAKGFEDTALYTYNHLISLNEVGGNPGASGLFPEAFHRYNLARQAHWPCTMNTTSTHDTKRSEDVRARINVLSENPETWERHLARWIQWNQSKKRNVKGQPVPEAEMEVLIYQTLIGAWPLSTEEIPEFKERFKAYIVKAAREARVFTNWLSPNTGYESALLTFVESILDSSDQNRFLKDLLQYQKQIAYYGALNALAQVLLKITSPGVPDFYQGTELWNFNLTDPDNRRQVYFGERIKHLEDLVRRESRGQSPLVDELLASWEDGRIKLYVTYKALNVRMTHRVLFLEGDYIPLQARSQKQEHVCAFARRHRKQWVLVAVPRLLSQLVRVGKLPLGQQMWEKDVLQLPKGAPRRWRHAFTGEIIDAMPEKQEIPLSDLFLRFPVALLVSAPEG